MEAVLKAVKCDSNVNRTAIDHSIPPTTLKDRISRDRQENSNFSKEYSSVGFGKTRQDVMKIAENVAKEKNY